mmetsp:Transcript_73516/g.212953  ORF Transcript_73516/g.212953 Transcript_73516/m.212953 type:complete len:226 (+) Transcript_73516:244-921(+)
MTIIHEDNAMRREHRIQVDGVVERLAVPCAETLRVHMVKAFICQVPDDLHSVGGWRVLIDIGHIYYSANDLNAERRCRDRLLRRSRRPYNLARNVVERNHVARQLHMLAVLHPEEVQQLPIRESKKIAILKPMPWLEGWHPIHQDPVLRVVAQEHRFVQLSLRRQPEATQRDLAMNLGHGLELQHDVVLLMSANRHRAWPTASQKQPLRQISDDFGDCPDKRCGS